MEYKDGYNSKKQVEAIWEIYEAKMNIRVTWLHEVPKLYAMMNEWKKV